MTPPPIPPPYSASQHERMKWSEFLRRIASRDFDAGEMFWLNGVRFSVVQLREDGVKPGPGGVGKGGREKPYKKANTPSWS